MFVFGFKQQTCAVQHVTYDMNVIEEMKKEGYPHPQVQQEQGWVNEIGQSLDSGEFDFVVIITDNNSIMETLSLSLFQCYKSVEVSALKILYNNESPSDDEKTFITDKVQSFNNKKNYI